MASNKVLSWDMPGQGDSGRLPGHFPVRGYSELAIDLVTDIFAGERPIMAGASNNIGGDNDRFSSICRAGQDGHRTIHK
jgi:hypothetical protein